MTDQKLKKKKRQKTIEEAGILLTRINPNKESFDIFDEISEIQNFIYKSGVKLGEQSKENRTVEDLGRITKVIKLSS